VKYPVLPSFTATGERFNRMFFKKNLCHNPGKGRNFLNRKQKSLTIKENIDELNSINIK
jgi:hypothetical protein